MEAPEREEPDFFSRRDWLLLHFFVSAAGLLQLLWIFSVRAHGRLLPPGQGFNDWVYYYYYPRRPQELVYYACSLSVLGAYAALVYWLAFKRPAFGVKAHARLREAGSKRIYLGLLFAVNAALAAAVNTWVPLSPSLWLGAATAAWAAVTAYPFWEAVSGEVALLDARSGLGAGLFLLACLQFFSIFQPYLSKRLLMLNEFMDIPEKTLLDGRPVDNTAYINEHGLQGLRLYDLRKDAGGDPEPAPGTSIPLPMTPMLSTFIESNALSYSYDRSRGLLVLNRAMELAEYGELLALFPDASSRAAVSRLYFSSRERSTALARRDYSEEERQFLRKNRLELHWKILNRWVIHHCNFVLGPINEYALGKPISKINMQYGLFNVLLMKFLLDRTGGLSYANYFRVWFSFWPLYYAFFLLGIYLIFRDLRYVSVCALLTFAFVNLLGYQILFLGPGLNPIRHFFDIAVLLCLYLQLERRGRIWLVLALLLALAAIVNNREFGLFIFGAWLAAWLAAFVKGDAPASRIDAVLVLAAAAAAAALAVGGRLGGDTMAHYYLEGFASFELEPAQIFAILAAFIAGYWIFLACFDRVRGAFKYAALLWFLYVQCVFFYYIWGATPNHLLNIASIAALAAVFLLRLAASGGLLRLREGAVLQAGLLGSLAFYAASTSWYYSTRHRYLKVFDDHQVYRWDLPTARFSSTMDPEPFEAAVRLIKKYAAAGPAVHIVSKYDNFLPILAGKYSAMPFFDVPWFLLTPKENAACVDRIERDRPEYLFVDSDIDRSLNGEVLFDYAALGKTPSEDGRLDPEDDNPEEAAVEEEEDPPVRAGQGGEPSPRPGQARASGLSPAGKPVPAYRQLRLGADYEESLLRVSRLRLLREVFDAVRGHYAPVEKGPLITVYRRLTEREQ